MRRYSVFILFFILLSACSQNNSSEEPIKLVGESDYWQATLNVQDDKVLALHYKGDDMQSVGDVSFTVELNNTGIGGSDYRLDENGSIELKLDDFPSITKDSVVEVTVEWEQGSESFQVH